MAAYARKKRAERRRARIAALMAAPEGRATAVAVQWRLNCTAEEARRVAVLVEPGPVNLPGHVHPVMISDRPAIVANMSWSELVKLARRAGVRPGDELRQSRRLPTVEEMLRRGHR
jgi:formylglycine-generating enzyme required for sulfatase activity